MYHRQPSPQAVVTRKDDERSGDGRGQRAAAGRYAGRRRQGKVVNATHARSPAALREWRTSAHAQVYHRLACRGRSFAIGPACSVSASVGKGRNSGWGPCPADRDGVVEPRAAFTACAPIRHRPGPLPLVASRGGGNAPGPPGLDPASVRQGGTVGLQGSRSMAVWRLSARGPNTRWEPTRGAFAQLGECARS